jgi:hypothetical protein
MWWKKRRNNFRVWTERRSPYSFTAGIRVRSYAQVSSHHIIIEFYLQSPRRFHGVVLAWAQRELHLYHQLWLIWFLFVKWVRSTLMGPTEWFILYPCIHIVMYRPVVRQHNNTPEEICFLCDLRHAKTEAAVFYVFRARNNSGSVFSVWSVRSLYNEDLL